MKLGFVSGALGIALAAVAVAEDPEAFDLENPPLPEPGKRYALTIEPGKGAGPVRLIFVAGSEEFGKSDEGKVRTNIEELIQEDVGNLRIANDGGVVHVDVGDYDLDGYRDFRVLSGWGSGGSWYNYYRFDGSKYVEWKEPQELGINSIQPEAYYACAFGRAGPSWSASHFRIEPGRFVLYEREIYDQASYQRESVPASVPDSHYVRITDRIRGDRVIHRKVEIQNPWEDDAEAKTVFDETIDEPVDADRQQD